MKKLISVCLVLVMVLTTAVPVLAAPLEDPDGTKSAYVFDPEVQEWIDAHPEEVEEFLAGGIDAYVREHFEYDVYDCVAEMAEAWGASEAYLRDVLLEWWVQETIETEEWNAWFAAYEAAHPGVQEQLEANAYDYFAQEYTWYDSPEEYMECWEITEEEFIAQMVGEQLSDLQAEEERQAELAAFEAEHPGMLAWFEANAYDYFAKEYIWYDSPEEYMEGWDLTEEEFIAEMVDEQIADFQAEEARRARLDNMKTELGGVPGQIGVMLNGQYISFPDAAPELADGRVMAPYRALMEALGGEVDFDSATQTATCILGDETLTLTIGESALTVREDSGSTTVEMDCAAYIKDGRTYVPVRFVSQAFGYDVLWDQNFETAVLLDGAAVAAQIDEDFTILNRAIAYLMPEPDQAQRIDSSVSAKLTLFDTISGDQVYNFTGSMQSLTRNGSGRAEVNLDLSALRDMFDLDALRKGWLYDEEDLDALETFLDSTDKLSLETITNQEEGVIYLSSPLLGLVNEEWDGAWLSAELGETGLFLEDWTIGHLCYQLSKSEAGSWSYYDYYSYYGSPVYLYEQSLETGETLAELIGDSCFTHTAQGDTLTLTPESLGLDLDPDFSYNPFSGLVMNVTLTVADSGAASGGFEVRVPGPVFGMLTGRESTLLLAEGSFDLGKERRTLTMDMHLRNTYRLEVEAVDNVAASSAEPVTAPPAGAKVVDMDDAL